jgi:hypothetical protein
MTLTALLRRLGSLLAVLALLNSVLAPVMAPVLARTSAGADPQRLEIVSLFGADVLCLPAGGGEDHSGGGVAVHDCQLCCTARLPALSLPTVAVQPQPQRRLVLAAWPSGPEAQPVSGQRLRQPYSPRDPPATV